MVNSCKITSELIDKQQISPLTAKEKIQLQAHKAICKTCNSYEKQSGIIERVISKWFKLDGNETKEKLSDQKKNAIIEAIKKK